MTCGVRRPLHGVQVQPHHAIRKPTGRQPRHARAEDRFQGHRCERRLPIAGRPDHRGVEPFPQPLHQPLQGVLSPEEPRRRARHLAGHRRGRGVRSMGGVVALQGSGRPCRNSPKDMVAKDVASGLIDLRVPGAGLGEGDVVLLLGNWVVSNAGMGARGIYDAEARKVPALVVRECLDTTRGMIAVAVVELPQVRVMRSQVLNEDRGPKDRRECIQQACKVGPAMRCPEEQDRPQVGRPVLLPWVMHVIRGPSQDLLGQQATQAVANAKQRPLAEARANHQVEDFRRAVRQGHGMAGIARPTPEPAQKLWPFAGARGKSQGPYADVGEVLSEPVRPRGCFVLSMAPRRERVTPEAMDEEDVRSSRWVLASGDGVKLAHGLDA